jgi:hypothetical protein
VIITIICYEEVLSVGLSTYWRRSFEYIGRMLKGHIISLLPYRDMWVRDKDRKANALHLAGCRYS